MSRRQFTSLAVLLGFGCGEGPPTSGQPGSPAGKDGGGPDPKDGGPPDAEPPGGSSVSSITLHPSESGVLPYMATVFPLEGVVPDGSTILSDDDPALRGVVLSRWPDGSASVVVVAGEVSLSAGSPKQIALRAGAPSGKALEPSVVAEVVTSVSVDCGALGSASIESFGSPERIWWASPSVICCRYRAAVGSDASLEAVVDVHVFASKRAFVEVVLENGKVDPTAASPEKPAAKSYTASLSVNGKAIASVQSPAAGQHYESGRGGGTYAGEHEAFRAWYVSTWVGGDPKVEVTHDAAALQAHPLFFRCWKPAPGDFQDEYGDAAYEPWSAGLLNVPGMPGTGDIEGIGPLTQWDTRYLQTGSKFVRRAVIALRRSERSRATSITATARAAASRAMHRRPGTTRMSARGRRPRASPRGRWRITRQSAWSRSSAGLRPCSSRSRRRSRAGTPPAFSPTAYSASGRRLAARPGASARSPTPSSCPPTEIRGRVAAAELPHDGGKACGGSRGRQPRLGHLRRGRLRSAPDLSGEPRLVLRGRASRERGEVPLHRDQPRSEPELSLLVVGR